MEISEGTPAKRAKIGPHVEVLAPRKVADMTVSAVALGCFSFGGDRKTGSHLSEEMAKLHQGVWGEQSDEDTFATVKAPLDTGINFFDNAEMYGDGYAEEVLGRALKASGYDRSEYIIATKVSETYLAPDLVKEHVKASIVRMDCQYLDLIQLHWHSRAAVSSGKYPERPLKKEVPLADTLMALNELREAGLVRHIGACNFGVEDMRCWLRTPVPMVSNQLCYNLLWRGIESEVVPMCVEHGIAILPWSPVAQGLLTGKYKHADEVLAGRARSRLFSSKRPQQRHGEAGLEEETFRAIRKMKWIADKMGQPLQTVALAWLLRRSGVTSVLMGARNPEQLRSNLSCLKVELPDEVDQLLSDAGVELLTKLGSNLDPYETAEHTRIK